MVMKKRSFLLSLFAMMMVAMVSVSFVSCSDDDDDENGGGNSNGGSSVGLNNPLAKEGNLLLTKVECSNSDYSFEIKYDSKNRPVSIVYSEDDIISIDYEKGMLGYDGEFIDHVTFTSQGFLKAMSYNMSYGGDYEKGSTTCSYDADGHLTKVDGNWQYKEDGEYGSETFGYTFEWANGNLFNSSSYSKGNEGNFTWDEKDDRIVEYSNYENKFRQLTHGLISVLDVEDDFAVAGLYGIGPKNLPKRVVEEDKTTTFEYELNQDGTIRQEKVVMDYGSDEYTRTYTLSYTPAN